MRYLKTVTWSLLFMMSTACVTINIYFPAAEAEEAARAIVREILGKDDAPADPATPQKQSLRKNNLSPEVLVVRFFDAVFPAAHAGVNINVNTPAINSIRTRLAERQSQLDKYYQAGAIGFGGDGLIAYRDMKAVSLKERRVLKKLVADDNQDRQALYREIAKANGHPEWEKDVQATFAKVWIQEARRGYWYQGQSGWMQK